jgi:hypothetical protein
LRELKKITLSLESVDYIKSILKHGNTISSYLLKNCDLEKGKVITFLPFDVSKEDAKQFTFGGKFKYSTESAKMLPMPPNIYDYLVEVIQSFLKKGKGRLCIFEDKTSLPNDPLISLKDTRIFICESEVYYILCKEDAGNIEKINDTIWDSDSHWHFVCVMTSVSKENSVLKNNKKINHNDLKLLAERAEKIVIGAYDGEGFLIWNKS